MPRHGTSDAHAELAVALYERLLVDHGWRLDRSWLAIAMLLMTCEIWRDGEWRALYGAPVLRESNDYSLTKRGTPNKALSEALQVRKRISAELTIEEDLLCSQMGQFFRHPEINSLQPNNPRGHAFRSLVAETLARFGDPRLDVSEEVSPHDLFPGYDFGNRSKDARIDIVVRRGPRPVALITTRWTYRHDRVDIIDEARAYMPAARNLTRDCRFFGVTAEFGSARLKKVISQTSPAMRNSAIDRLVHLNPELPSELIGKNGDLRQMWSLEKMVQDSHNWS
jgi:hypothetical protein